MIKNRNELTRQIRVGLIFGFVPTLLLGFLLLAASPVKAQDLPQFTITIERGAPNGDAIAGQLTVNGQGVGATLERNGVEIAAGNYAGTLKYFSPNGHDQGPFGSIGKHGDFLIEVTGVANDRHDLLLHGGSVPKHSKGCILLGAIGKSDGSRFVPDEATLRKLRLLFYGSDVPTSTPAVNIVIVIHDAEQDAPAGNYEPGGKYDACITEFYDPKTYNWLSYRNGCVESLRILFLPNNGAHFASSMTLKSGRSDSTGYSKSEVEAKHGFTKAICQDGWLPVDEHDRVWNSSNGRYRCKLQPK